MIDAYRTRGYLERIGIGPADELPATLATLTQLHRRHVEIVPFENFSIHLGEPIVLDTNRLVDKVTVQRRGGFCYELNGAFAGLLRALGFSVELLEARVCGADGEVGIRFDHLCLCVTLDKAYLVDVGFGAGFLEPLALDAAGAQVDPAGSFEVVARVDGWFDLVQDGTAQYRFSRETRALLDFVEGCRHHQTSPLSPFTKNTICSLPTASGRVTLRGRTRIVTSNGERVEDELSADQFRRELDDVFGIVLNADPGNLRDPTTSVRPAEAQAEAKPAKPPQ